MTPHREDYIKAIYNYNENKEKVTNKLLAESLEISPPSVSEMISKLIEAKILTKDKVYGYLLSEKGCLEAQRLINKHRLWEVFLVEHLGYTWDQVHDDAEVLEHATSDLLLDRLNEFLKYPTFCPHGSVIYGNESQLSKLEALSNIRKGKIFTIRKISDGEGLASYLFNKKVSLDRSYTLNNIDSFDGSIEIKDEEGTLISLSSKAMNMIYVEVLV